MFTRRIGVIYGGRMGEANHADCVESGRCGKARCLFHFWLRDWFVAGRLSEDLHFALSQNLATPVYMFTGTAVCFRYVQCSTQVFTPARGCAEISSVAVVFKPLALGGDER